MSETFTPGPWEFSEELQAGGIRIYAWHGPVRVSPATAAGLQDAHLIASAPDLWKALKAASHALRSYQYGNSDGSLAMSVADHADAVLAKSCGETS